MFYGKFPEKDHAGRDWPAKSARATTAGKKLNSHNFCGCIWAITGDGEHFQNELKLAGWSHNNCCFSCHCNKSDLPFNDFRASAEWRKTVVQHKGATPTKHEISKVPGVNGHSFCYDTLHILEEGVTSHVIANIMFDMVIHGEVDGATQELRIKTLFKKLCGQYEELGINSSNQVRRLQLSTFCNPKKKYDNFPELSGVKARHIRYLVSPFVQLCQEMCDDGSYKKHRLQCITSLEKMYTALETEGLHPPHQAYKDYKKSTDLCLLHYSKLAKIAISKHLLQWSTVHKHHLACHMPDQLRFLNCKFVSTYSGETMVGFMASLGHSCLNGTPPHMVSAKVAWRYRLGMHLRLTHGDFDVMGSDEEL